MAKTVNISEETFEVLDDLVNYTLYRNKKAIIDEAINLLYVRDINEEQLIKLIRNKHNSYETALDNKYGVAN